MRPHKEKPSQPGGWSRSNRRVGSGALNRAVKAPPPPQPQAISLFRGKHLLPVFLQAGLTVTGADRGSPATGGAQGLISPRSRSLDPSRRRSLFPPSRAHVCGARRSRCYPRGVGNQPPGIPIVVHPPALTPYTRNRETIRPKKGLVTG